MAVKPCVRGRRRRPTHGSPIPGEPATGALHTVTGDDASPEVALLRGDAGAAVTADFRVRFDHRVAETLVRDLLVEHALHVARLHAFPAAHGALPQQATVTVNSLVLWLRAAGQDMGGSPNTHTHTHTT